MPGEFASVDEAKAHAATVFSLNPEETNFEEVEGLKVHLSEATLLNCPNAPLETRAAIREQIEAQRGFEFTGPKGKRIQIVIGPCGDGFGCWVIKPTGKSVRL